MRSRKTLMGAVIAAFAGFSTGCDVAPTAPDPEHLTKPRLAANSEQEQMVVPFTYTGLHPCSGIPMTIVGTMHMTTRSTEPSSGGLLQHMHSNWQGSGADVLGNSYRGKDEQDQTVNVTPGETFETTWTISTAFIATGRNGLPLVGQDFWFHSTYHVTIPDGGLPTAEVTRERLECRG